MNDYVYKDGELYHYGVKGMKWGVRKAREIYTKGLERKRRKDRADYVREQVKTRTQPSGRPVDSMKKSIENKRNYKLKDSKTALRIARQKAKNDPGYKNSDEYKSVVIEYGKQHALDTIRKLMSAPAIGRR